MLIFKKICVSIALLFILFSLVYISVNFYVLKSVPKVGKYYSGIKEEALNKNTVNRIENYSLESDKKSLIQIIPFEKSILDSPEKAVLNAVSSDRQAVKNDIVIFTAGNSKSVKELQSYYPFSYRIFVATYPQLSRHRSVNVNSHPNSYSFGNLNKWDPEFINKLIYPADADSLNKEGYIDDFYIFDYLQPDKIFLIKNYTRDALISTFRITQDYLSFFGLTNYIKNSLVQNPKIRNVCLNNNLNTFTIKFCSFSYSNNNYVTSVQNKTTYDQFEYTNNISGFSVTVPSEYKSYFPAQTVLNDKNVKITRVFKDKNKDLNTAIYDLVSNYGSYEEDVKDLKIVNENNDLVVKKVGELFPADIQVAYIMQSNSTDDRLKGNFIIYDPKFSDRFFIFTIKLIPYLKSNLYQEEPNFYLSNGLPWFSSFKVIEGEKRFSYVSKSKGLNLDKNIEKVNSLYTKYDYPISKNNNFERSYTLTVSTPGDSLNGFDFNSIFFSGHSSRWLKSAIETSNPPEESEGSILELNDPASITEIKNLFLSSVTFKIPEKVTCSSCLVSSNHYPDYIELFNENTLNYVDSVTNITGLLYVSSDFSKWVLLQDMGDNKYNIHIFNYSLVDNKPTTLIYSAVIPLTKSIIVPKELSYADFDFFELTSLDFKNKNFTITERYCNYDSKSCFYTSREKFCTNTIQIKNGVVVSSVKKEDILCTQNR